MKCCKKDLHFYEGKQCNECEKAWRKANMHRILASNRKYQERNKEKIKASRKVDKEAVKAWKKANRHKLTALQVKRESAKLQRTPKWLTINHFQQIEIFYKQAYELTKQLGVQMDVDHIVPLQGKNVSGLHVPWNLQVIPHAQNMSKGNRYV